MNYASFKRNYKTWEYDREMRKSLSYKGPKPFHGSYQGDSGYALSPPKNPISTKYL